MDAIDKSIASHDKSTVTWRLNLIYSLIEFVSFGFDLTGRVSDQFRMGWNHQATRLISFQAILLGQLDEGGDKNYGAAGVMQFQF